MWKLLVNSQEIISFEKRKRNLNIRIEARKNSRNRWEVFKTYNYKNHYNVVKEYKTVNRNDAERLVHQLKEERDLSVPEIMRIKEMEAQPLNLDMKRVYKEYEVEKWEFTLFKHDERNVVIVRFADALMLDLVLHMRYKNVAERVVKEIVKMLGAEELGIDVLQDIFFYEQNVKRATKGEKKMLMGSVEMGFDI